MTAAFRVGETDGLASGRSTVGQQFGSLGVSVIGADQVARDVVAAGSPALRTIIDRFSLSIIKTDGTLNRHHLRETVFASDERRLALGEIVHPIIRQEMQLRLSEIDAPYAISMILFIFSSDQGSNFDCILVVDAEISHQIERARARDGSTTDTLQGILLAQHDRDARLVQADDVIHDNGSIASPHSQVERLHEHYLSLVSRLRVDQQQ